MREVDAAVEQMQRHDLRRQSRAHRLRARDLSESHLRARDGRREVLASHFEGKELNSPNDVCMRSDGAIYFSDPWYGRMPVYGVERPRQQGFQGVYRVPHGGGEPQLLVDRNLFEQTRRPLLLARRKAPLCQRHGALSNPRIRRQRRRHARPGPDFRVRHPLPNWNPACRTA